MRINIIEHNQMKIKSMRRSNRNRNRNHKNKTRRGGGPGSALKQRMASLTNLDPKKRELVINPGNPVLGAMSTFGTLRHSSNHRGRARMLAHAASVLPARQSQLHDLVNSKEFQAYYKLPNYETSTPKHEKIAAFANSLGYKIVKNEKGVPVDIKPIGRQ